jgi:hypothetical protein
MLAGGDMKAESVLKSVNAALSCVETAKEFSRYDYMVESMQQQLGEAVGHLKATQLYLELELGKPFASEQEQRKSVQ